MTNNNAMVIWHMSCSRALLTDIAQIIPSPSP